MQKIYRNKILNCYVTKPTKFKIKFGKNLYLKNDASFSKFRY